MKLKVQIIVEHEDLDGPVVEEIVCLCRGDLLPETLGLTLEEGKEMLAKIQERMVTHQASQYLEQQRSCPVCGHRRGNKDGRKIVWRSLFGKLHIDSPRLYTCPCQAQTKQSFSPLAELLQERTAPELRYLQSKWASLVSYGFTVDLLEEVLPIQTNVATVFLNLHQVAERLEGELGPGGSRAGNVCGGMPGRARGLPEELPRPDERLTVGIDGGYVHAREGDNRKAGWFEVIVGKSMASEVESKRLGFVVNYDQKPKRRLFEMLQAQGLQMNQSITFLSDGGDTVRDLQFYLSPQSEHVLDWFHITMRLTVMRQMAKGLTKHAPLQDVEEDLDRVKWHLWHGNVFRALQLLEYIQMDLEMVDEQQSVFNKVVKLTKAVREFHGYIEVNRSLIPNYGERYRYGETISTAFVESTVNEVISKRMVKKQQMRWTQKGAHLLLQVRTKTLNGDLKDTFRRWYPAVMPQVETPNQMAA